MANAESYGADGFHFKNHEPERKCGGWYEFNLILILIFFHMLLLLLWLSTTWKGGGLEPQICEFMTFPW